jgi:phosphatidate cytidylyltransferase
LRGEDVEGLKTVVFVFVVVWSTDIMAYFVGRTFGGPKLAPAISPGKTWSGAVGGAVFALVLGMFAAFMMETRMAVGALFALIFVLSVASQIGDLFESGRRSGCRKPAAIRRGSGGGRPGPAGPGFLLTGGAAFAGIATETP